MYTFATRQEQMRETEPKSVSCPLDVDETADVIVGTMPGNPRKDLLSQLDATELDSMEIAEESNNSRNLADGSVPPDSLSSIELTAKRVSTTSAGLNQRPPATLNDQLVRMDHMGSPSIRCLKRVINSTTEPQDEMPDIDMECARKHPSKNSVLSSEEIASTGDVPQRPPNDPPQTMMSPRKTGSLSSNTSS